MYLAQISIHGNNISEPPGSSDETWIRLICGQNLSGVLFLVDGNL